MNNRDIETELVPQDDNTKIEFVIPSHYDDNGMLHTLTVKSPYKSISKNRELLHEFFYKCGYDKKQTRKIMKEMRFTGSRLYGGEKAATVTAKD